MRRIFWATRSILTHHSQLDRTSFSFTMNAAMRCSCTNMSGGVVRGATPGLARQIPAAMLPTARSALSGQQLVSVRQRSRSSAGMSVRTMAAAATADTIYDFKVKVWTPLPYLPSPHDCLLSPSPDACVGSSFTLRSAIMYYHTRAAADAAPGHTVFCGTFPFANPHDGRALLFSVCRTSMAGTSRCPPSRARSCW